MNIFNKQNLSPNEGPWPPPEEIASEFYESFKLNGLISVINSYHNDGYLYDYIWSNEVIMKFLFVIRLG